MNQIKIYTCEVSTCYACPARIVDRPDVQILMEKYFCTKLQEWLTIDVHNHIDDGCRLPDKPKPSQGV